MASFTLPNFSNPVTRTDFNNTLQMLVAFFINQGFSASDAQTDAGTAINLKGQGMTNDQIATAIDSYHQTRSNLAANQVQQATQQIATDNSKVLPSTPTATASKPVSSVTSTATTAKTAKSIIIYNQVSSGVWRVTLAYSDGTTSNYTLSTANVDYWLQQGAQLIDQSNGQWGNPLVTNNQPVTASTPANTAQNVSFSLSFYQGLTKISKYDTAPVVTTLADYQSLNSSVRKAYGAQVVFNNVTTTTQAVTANAASLSEQVDATIALIKNQAIPNPTTTGGTLNGQNISQPVQFNIILPSGASKTNVVLSANDYIKLQNNVGIFTIQNAKQGSFAVNSTYDQLLAFMNGNTNVSTSSSNLKTSNNATENVDATKTTPAPVKTVTKVTVYNLVSGTSFSDAIFRTTLSYSDSTQKSYQLSAGNIANYIGQGAQLVDLTNGAWQKIQPAKGAAQQSSTTQTTQTNGLQTFLDSLGSGITGIINKITNPNQPQPAPVPSTPASSSSSGATDLLTQIETEAGTLISTAESNINGILAKLNGSSPAAPSTPSPVDTGSQGSGASSTTAQPATVTGLTIFSQVDANDWRIALAYSDGTTKNLVLSTANIQTYLDQGAALTDLSGSWGKQTATTTTSQSIKDKIAAFVINPANRKYLIGGLAGLVGFSGVVVFTVTRRKRGIVQNV